MESNSSQNKSSSLRILILGGTGKVGRVVAKTALTQGHKVRSITRDTSKAAKLKLGDVEWVQGSVFDENVLKKALEGQDAVISVLGPAGLGKTNIYSESAKLVVNAMLKNNVKRYLCITQGKTSDNMGCFKRAMIKKLLAKVWEDANSMKVYFENLGNDQIDWTVVQPFPLNDKKLSHKYRVASGHINPPLRPQTSKADLAEFLVSEAGKKNWAKQVVTIGM